MDNSRQEFDEQAALQALEQLRDQIQRARSRREQKVAEFEAFVRTNREASQAERTAALDELEAASGIQAAARTADRAGDPPRPRTIPEPAPSPAPQFVRREPMPSPYKDYRALHDVLEDERPAWWMDRRYQIGAGIAALILLMLVFVRPWSGGAADVTDARAGDPAAATPSTGGAPPPGDEPAEPAPPAAAGVPDPATAAEPRPLRIGVTTLRPVWMRVMVDGARRVEREVPANQTLTFGADRVIVLRVGDAGGVSLSVNGVDQGRLGRDGQIAVRTLTPPER